MKGQLWIVAAPSGGGKTSLIAETCRQLPKVIESVSHTTREQRNGEIEGTHYYFVTKETFAAMRAQGDFLECAEVFHNSYGTSARQVDRLLAQGYDVILSIDWQGAQQVQAKRADVTSVFLLPPSLAALNERLTNRGQDRSEIVQQRMQEANAQIAHYVDFDYIIINDDFNRAAKELQALIIASRLQRQRCAEELARLVDQLAHDHY